MARKIKIALLPRRFWQIEKSTFESAPVYCELHVTVYTKDSRDLLVDGLRSPDTCSQKELVKKGSGFNCLIVFVKYETATDAVD